MRKLWLLFAQAVTLTLAAIFVVSLVKPDWLAWRNQVVEVRETPAVPAPGSLATATDVGAPSASPSATRPARRRPRW